MNLIQTLCDFGIPPKFESYGEKELREFIHKYLALEEAFGSKTKELEERIIGKVHKYNNKNKKLSS